MRVIVDATHACLDPHREPEFGVGREQEWLGVLCSKADLRFQSPDCEYQNSSLRWN
jgi:hypothetical protein